MSDVLSLIVCYFRTWFYIVLVSYAFSLVIFLPIQWINSKGITSLSRKKSKANKRLQGKVFSFH